MSETLLGQLRSALTRYLHYSRLLAHGTKNPASCRVRVKVGSGVDWPWQLKCGLKRYGVWPGRVIWKSIACRSTGFSCLLQHS